MLEGLHPASLTLGCRPANHTGTHPVSARGIGIVAKAGLLASPHSRRPSRPASARQWHDTPKRFFFPFRKEKGSQRRDRSRFPRDSLFGQWRHLYSGQSKRKGPSIKSRFPKVLVTAEYRSEPSFRHFCHCSGIGLWCGSRDGSPASAARFF